MDEIIALLPLRGGSKSILKKNIKILAGKPLCAWSLNSAVQSNIFDRVLVSTDSQEIAEVVKGLKLKVEVIMRPSELATDTASTESVMLHIAEKFDFKTIVTIQATSPLVQSIDFIKAKDIYINEKLESLLTGVRNQRFYWTLDSKPINYDPLNRPMRQDYEGIIMENGAFYFTSRKVLDKYHCRLGGRIGIYEMQPESATEIDEPSDWDIVEQILIKRKKANAISNIHDIKLLVVDVDGTLTDGGMYYSSEGEMLKKFNTRDAKGLELIKNKGIEVAIVTSENSNIVTSRAKKLGIQYCYLGIKNKLIIIDDLCKILNINYNQVAFIGDDINDLECIKKVGFPACPSDAENLITANSVYISRFPGGSGAVRDCCNFILSHL